MFRKALIILLQSRGCWTPDGPKIPEEISAQFDLPLDEAREICELASAPQNGWTHSEQWSRSKPGADSYGEGREQGQ